MNIRFFITLEAILRHGSFAEAGNEVGLTASAVSLQVQKMEQYFGQPLFDRSSRTARPTEFARQVVATTKPMMMSIDGLRLKQTLDISGQLTIGTIRSVQTTTLPSTLQSLHNQYPELEIRIVQGDSRDLMHKLSAGLLDAAVVVRPTPGGSNRFAWYDLAREPFILLAPPQSEGDSALELLQTYEWIRFDTTLTSGRIAGGIVHKITSQARGCLEFGSIVTIVAMVSAGLGVSVVPRPRERLLSAYPAREISLDSNTLERQIAFVCRVSDQDNRTVQVVRESFEKIYTSENRPVRLH